MAIRYLSHPDLLKRIAGFLGIGLGDDAEDRCGEEMRKQCREMYGESLEWACENCDRKRA